VELIDGLGLDRSADELGQNPGVWVTQVVRLALVTSEPDRENKVPVFVP
jgi:hypothetical protein